MNNNAIYNAAVAGAGGGLHERWLTLDNANDYSAISSEINRFATAVDDAIAAGTITDSDANVMQSICAGIMSGRYLVNQTEAQLTAIAQATAGLFTQLQGLLQPVPSDGGITSPVYVENYLASNNNDIRSAIRAAFLANPTAGQFILPPGEWEWIGIQLTLTDGFRNNIRITGQQTRLYIDQAGIASNQRIMFLRSETGVTHGDRIVFEGIRFSLLNVLTSFSGYAVGIEAASNCRIINCEADCTLAVGATDGHLRWGFGLFGGDWTSDPTGGTNNIFHNIKLSFAQLQGCAQPRSCNGVIFNNIQCQSANDLCLSCVSTTTGTVKNVLVNNITCNDVGGSGVILLGNDGNTVGTGCVLVENIIVNNVVLTGQRNPDTLFNFSAEILIYGGLITRNVIVNGVASQLVPNASAQASSIIINSQDDETSWEGLSVSNCQCGVVTSNDPLYGLAIIGTNMSQVSVTNVKCKGKRGMLIKNADALEISNCSTDDGTCLIQASSRNLTGGITVANSRFKSVTGFNSVLFFQSTNGKNFSKVSLSNLVLDSNVAGLLTGLTGGTMSMIISNIENTSNSNLAAETVTGIIRAVNTRGFFITTTILVAVPAVAAAVVAYVDVSMAGTRLADLAVGENIVVNPQADLIAAGAGGGIVSARVSAIGTVRIGYSGVANANVNHSFARAAA